MPLTDKQRAALEAKAAEMKVDPAKLIAEAESLASSDGKPSASKPGSAADKPNLYMYLLPFVTVNEVRTIWLDLDAVAGGDAYAAEWAARISGTVKPDPGTTE